MVRRRGMVALAVLLMVPLVAPVFGLEGSGDEELAYQEDIDYDHDGDVDEGDLARAAQNPVGDLISLPFQNNMNFDVGPAERTQNILNIQPVWPISMGKKWNLITRTILPVISQPAPGYRSHQRPGRPQLHRLYLTEGSRVRSSGAPARRSSFPPPRTTSWEPTSGASDLRSCSSP